MLRGWGPGNRAERVKKYPCQCRKCAIISHYCAFLPFSGLSDVRKIAEKAGNLDGVKITAIYRYTYRGE